MFIDIHTHCYRHKPPFVCPFCTLDELIARYDEMKVEMAVIMPIVSPEIYLPQSVDDILEICDAHPDRFIPYCNIDPRSLYNSPFSPLEKFLKYYKEKGCKGLGEIMPTMPLTDLRMQNLLRAAEEVGLPVCYDGSAQKEGDFGVYDDPGLPMLEYSLAAFPKLLIFGHGPVFWSEIARLETVGERSVYMTPWGRQVGALPNTPIREEGTVPKLLRKYPNLMGDLADGTAYNALARDPSYGPRFMSEFEDRLFFGTDLCGPKQKVELCDLMISWREQGKISETTFRKVARENAEKLLGL